HPGPLLAETQLRVVVQAPAVTLAGHLPVAAQAADEYSPDAHLGPLPPTGDGGGRDNVSGLGGHPKRTRIVIPPAQEPPLLDNELPPGGNEMLSADAAGGIAACGQALPPAVTGAGGGKIHSVLEVRSAVGAQAETPGVVVPPAVADLSERFHGAGVTTAGGHHDPIGVRPHLGGEGSVGCVTEPQLAAEVVSPAP